MSTPHDGGADRGATNPGRRLGTPVGIVFATVLIDLIGFGIAIPILPLWAERLGASPAEVGLLLAAYAVCQLVFAPVWGRASDRHGRRRVILIALAGATAAALLTGLASALWLLFLARALHGAAGASYVAAQAYVADVTPVERRPRALGLIGAAFGLGFALGPAIGALLAMAGPRVPFFFVAALSAANLVVAWRLLPESRPVAPATNAPRELLGALRTGEWRSLLLVAFVASAGFVGVEATFALFANDRFGYGEPAVAALFAFIGVVAAVTQGGLVGPLAARVGEVRLLAASLAVTAGGAVLVATSEALWLLLLGLAVLSAGWGLSYSATLTLGSLAAGDASQGSALGAIAAAGGLARIVGPVVAGVAFQSLAPSAPLVAAAAILVVTALLVPGLLAGATQSGGRAGRGLARDIRPGETP